MTQSAFEESITDADKQRIIEHMNDDHADACLLYVTHFAGRADAVSAQLVDIRSDDMVLEMTSDTGVELVSVGFSIPIRSAQDAHRTLVDMVRIARENAVS
ncbi:MAG: DUF2470 domain-containing protein [Pseudomonadota bacterium]